MADKKTIQANQVAEAFVAVPGVAFKIIQLVPSVAQSYSSGTFADIGSGGDKAEAEFVAPSAGNYVFDISAQHHNTGSLTSIDYQLVVDQAGFNGFTEQTLAAGVDYAWSTLGVGAGQHGAGSWRTPPIYLAAGTHKLTGQYKVAQGSGAQLDVDDYFYVTGTLISGSAAAGVIVTKTSTFPTNRIRTSDGFDLGANPDAPAYRIDQTEVDIFELEIKGVAGEEVDVTFSGWGEQISGNFSSRINIWHQEPGGTYTKIHRIVNAHGSGNASNLSFNKIVSFVAAGTHKIKITGNAFTGESGKIQVVNDALQGHTIPSDEVEFAVTQYRGGIIPIEKDGVPVSSTARALNLVGDPVSVEEDGTGKLNLKVAPFISTWRYLDDVMPSGVTSPPEALYRWDGSADSLTDRSLNSHDLTVAAGQEEYSAGAAGLVGFVQSGNDALRAPVDAGLQIVGALTVEFLIEMHTLNAGNGHIFFCSATTGESLATNGLYQLAASNGGNFFQWFQEYASGSNVVHLSTAKIPFGGVALLTVTRASDGVTLKYYLNGLEVDATTLSNAAQKDASGNLQQLEFGLVAGVGYSARYYGCRITPEEFTAAQVKESFDRVYLTGISRQLKQSPMETLSQYTTSNPLTVASTTPVQILPESGTLSYTVNEKSRFKFTFSANPWLEVAGGGYSIATYRFKVVVDEGEADEVVIGNDAIWQKRFRSDDDRYVSIHLVGDAVLGAGEHTIKVYAEEVDPAGNAAQLDFYNATNSIGNQQPTLLIEPIMESIAVAGGAALEYLSTTSPTGAPAPEAVYQFDKSGSSLSDRTANGHNLTAVVGADNYVAINGLIGVSFRKNTQLQAALSTALHLDREITVEVLMAITAHPSVTESQLFNITGAVENPTGNELCQLSFYGTDRAWHYFAEYSAGTNVPDDTIGEMEYHLGNKLFLLTFTRDSAGTGLKWYMDAHLLHTSTASNAPEKDGTPANNTQLMSIGLNTFEGIIAAVRITEGEYTAEQVLAAAQQVGVRTAT